LYATTAELRDKETRQMAIHAMCEFCGHKLSVPDGLKGRRVQCPGCGKKTRVVTPLELSVEEARKNHEQKPAVSREEKQSAITEAQTNDPAPSTESQLQTASAPATRYPALRALGVVFTFFAYLVGLLGIALGIILFLNSPQQQGLLYLLGFFVGSVVAFCLFKLLSQLTGVLSDLGDMESQMLTLLFDMREKLDNMK
jgi:uncharacterized Zn finger protein (UPF0148 family)